MEYSLFQRDYLLVYAVVTLADWLQGTHFHALYESHGLTQEQTANLFLSGFVSSAVFGTFVGGVVDRVGRKRGCILYCVLEVLINAIEHSPDFKLLWVGRILGGISTSLLFSAFESWMVTAHKARGYSDELLRRTFSLMSVLNGLLAVGSGLLSHLLSETLGLGHIAPFQAAIALTVLAIALVSRWPENYGDAPAAEEDWLGALRRRILACERRVWLIGGVQALFEGGTYAFVSVWVPALGALYGEGLPHGLIFAMFMLCITAGGSLFSASQFGLGVPAVASLVLCAAFGSMLLPLVSPSPSFGRVLAAFCLFEATIGAFNPAFGVLRAEAIPPGIQSTVMNLYRLPLNFVVAGGTRLGSVGGWQAVVLMNSLTLPLALALQTVAATQRKDRRD